MEARLFIDGAWTSSERTTPVEHKYTAELLGEVHVASEEQVDRAVGALAAAHAAGPLHPYERFEILSRASALVEERRQELRDIIVAESGFTTKDADGEVTRAVQTLRLSGEEATRLNGEVVPLDGAPGVHHRMGYTVRHPLGVVAAITPFNSPLNTTCHKVGPALAAGNTVALKPATYTPFTAAALVHILLDAGLPGDRIALLQGGGGSVGQRLLEDPRIAFYTFTGSTEVGRHIQATVGLRGTQLELGSLSSTFVCADADLERAVTASVSAAFRKAGQVCTSIQRLYVERGVYDEVLERLAANVASLGVGDPADPDTDVGPVISAGDAERIEAWVTAAEARGATRVTGGDRQGRVIRPCLLTDVDPSLQVMCEEVFGPVMSVLPFDDLDAAVDEANDTPFGLSAGVFTNDLPRAFRAAERLRMGSVHINQTSSSRIDLMPYGGVKDSGYGHEGPRYAAREMSEEKLITITHA